MYLASSSINGKINVWSLEKDKGMPRIREYETKGSFGLCVDLVRLRRAYLIQIIDTPLEPQRKLHGLRPRKWIHIRLQQRDRPPCTFFVWTGTSRSHHRLFASIEASRSGRRCENHCSIRRHFGRAGRELYRPWRLDLNSGLE